MSRPADAGSRARVSNFVTGTVRFFMELRGLDSLPRVDDGEYGIVEYHPQASAGCATPGCTIDGFGRISFNPPNDAEIRASGDNLVDSVIFHSDPVRVIFNQPLSLDVSLSALTQAYAFVPGRVEANVDAYGTMIWGGFVEVLDSAGNPVTDCTVGSVSGVDRSKAIEAPPVPEPGAALLTLVGILGLIGVGKARGIGRPTPQRSTR